MLAVIINSCSCEPMMEEQIKNDSEIKLADDLVSKGDKAFLSYTWKLNKSLDDSNESSGVNPYSDDSWANDISYPEHDLELAFDYYQQALAKYEMILGSDHIKVGEILFNCGRVAMEPMYDDVIALDFLEKALPIYQNEKPYSRDLAILYEDLGAVCHAMNKLPSSLDYYNKSLILNYDFVICGEEEDISCLKDKICDAKQKLGLQMIKEGDKCGCADKEGNVIIPCIWKEISEFSEGLAVVKDDKDFWGYINYLGELVIPCVFRDALLFKEGWTFVEQDNYLNTGDPIDGIKSVIDYDGDIIGNNCCLPDRYLEIMFKAHRAAKASHYDVAVDLILPVAQNCSIDTQPIAELIDYYLALKQYGDVAKWCKIAMKKNDFNEMHDPYYPKLMGMLYQKGLGFELNPLEAFRWYNEAQLFRNDEDATDLINQLLEEHPELKEFPEVQKTLAPLEYDDDFD